MTPVIAIENASFAYPTARGGRLKRDLLVAHRLRGGSPRLALRGLSLVVRAGEVVGVIGPNGSGKTTLMRLVAGIIEPTAGRVVVRGSVAPMIQVGGALSPDLTVAENVVLLGSILGADPRAVRREVADIVGWAGLEEYIGEPVRTLSSGMAARLAFAVCTHRRPDVLVMDEILAVGDETFQRRSLQRVAELRDAGTSVLLVSHALDVIADRAQRCLWLDHGELRRAGDPADVVAAYRESRQAREPRA